MNLQRERISQLCGVLSLDRVASEWPGIAHHAAEQQASHADFLERLLQTENDARIERQRTALMKLATLPSIKTIEQYDFAFASGAPRAQILGAMRRRSSSTSWPNATSAAASC
jgi:DNA replication protein DnaC